MSRPWLLAVSGIMGAGKTTLARGLASELGWAYLPEASPAIRLLDDLFRDPTRWAFETQTAFLVNKAVQLRDALHRQPGVVLDRTLYEDAEVFARYFFEQGHIDIRSYETYRTMVEHFFSELPPPDLVIFCSCSLATAKRRLRKSPRIYRNAYPVNHLRDIDRLYSEWLDGYDQSTVAILDTVAVDTRKPSTITGLSHEILGLLAQLGAGEPQLDVFEEVSPITVPALPVLSVSRLAQLSAGSDTRRFPTSRVTRFPTAYLAAPFTGQAADPHEENDDAVLLSVDPIHGRIGPGPYRSFLLSIEEALSRLGIHTFIPHRDVNRWGTRVLTPLQVMADCSHFVRETDLFVGVLGMSHGSHYEFGLAQGGGKPTLLLHVKSIAQSFVAEGARAAGPNAFVVSIADFGGVQEAFQRSETLSFLSRYLPIRAR